MKIGWMIAGLLAGTLMVSCTKNGGGAGAATNEVMSSGYSSLKDGEFSESDFSPWMSKADQQVVYDGRADGTYFAYVEGRNNGGFHQYRHVLQKFDASANKEWGVFWGLTTEEFYQIDLKMQKRGFTRAYLQVFEDATGKSYHQGVWLLPAK